MLVENPPKVAAVCRVEPATVLVLIIARSSKAPGRLQYTPYNVRGAILRHCIVLL